MEDIYNKNPLFPRTSKVGLAIPTYNRLNYLEQFINSLYKSDLSKLDLICIVDDCSTENVRPLLERFKLMKENTILLKTKKNSQVWITLKAALDYLLYEGCTTLVNLDPDCILRKDWLNRVLDLHNRFPNDVVTGFNTITNHPIQQIFDDYYVKRSCGGINMVYNEFTYVEIIRESFESASGWDTAANRKTITSGRKVIVTKPSVLQHIGSDSTMGHHGGDRALDFIEDSNIENIPEKREIIKEIPNDIVTQESVSFLM